MKVFYHDDLDGKCSASIIAQYTKHQIPEDYIETDYNKPFDFSRVNPKERVYLLDLSLNEANARLLKQCIDEKAAEVIWIDHHRTSLDLLQLPEFEWLKSLEGIITDQIVESSNRFILTSGAMLTYLYLFTSRNKPIRPLDIHSVPYYIRLVSDYDTWSFRFDPETTYFKIGMDMEDHSPLASLWNEFSWSSVPKTKYQVERIVEVGRISKNYLDTTNEAYLNSYSYESSIGGHKCLVVNRASNSWIFGKLYGQYDLHMTWVFNGEVYQFTIYSTRSDINCAKIAQGYGGGGHVGVAGFKLDHMPFVKEK